MKKLVIAILAMGFLFGAMGVARADLTNLTLYLTSDHLTGGYGYVSDPPDKVFGEVVITDTGDDVQFLVTLNDNSQFVRTGAGDDFNFKFNASDVTLNDIKSVSGYKPISAGQATSPWYHGDGGGNFEFGVYFTGQGTGGANRMAGPLAFTVLNAEITDFIGQAQLDLNAKGQYFVADVYSGINGNTGLIDVSTIPQTPEPFTLGFLGLGLLGAGVAGRRFKK